MLVESAKSLKLRTRPKYKYRASMRLPRFVVACLLPSMRPFTCNLLLLFACYNLASEHQTFHLPLKASTEFEHVTTLVNLSLLSQSCFNTSIGRVNAVFQCLHKREEILMREPNKERYVNIVLFIVVISIYLMTGV